MFDIHSFEELKNIKEYQIEELENHPVKSKQTVKYKKNKVRTKKVDGSDDTIAPMVEKDEMW